MKTQMVAAFVIALGLVSNSYAVWDEKSDNQLEMQIAKQNAVSRSVEYLDQKTGQELHSDDYVSELKIVSAQSKDDQDALPATFEVTLLAGGKDGTPGAQLIQTEVDCVRGRTNQVSRFTRVTTIDCSVVRAQ